MQKLTNPKVVRKILNKYNFHFKKELGQNFIQDENIVNKIINSLEPKKDDIVIEIGPGIGTMTQIIKDKVDKVLAIEIDTRLITILKDIFQEDKNITFVNADVLKIDIEMLVQEIFGTKKVKIISNLPYYITSPIIMKILQSSLKYDNIIIMLQKEVAQRMLATPNSKDYSIFSIAVQYYADVKMLFDVSENVFTPRPKVTSTVLRLTPKKIPPAQVNDITIFFKTVKAAFSMRRKTLLNTLSHSLKIKKEDIKDILSICNLAPSLRAENLSIKDFALLSNAIKDANLIN